MLFVVSDAVEVAADTGTSRFLRVGLESHFRERSQITIYSHTLAVGHFSADNFHVSGHLTAETSFVARPDNSAYIRLGYSFLSLTRAQDMATSYAGAIPALMGNGTWGLYFPVEDAPRYGYAVPVSSSRVSLSVGGQIVLISDNVATNLQIRDTQGITSLGVRQYRGIIEFARFGGNLLTAVNIVDIEEYLLSVVPAEMPPGWHMEALKAQAVAARTYTVFRLGSLAHRGYDLCDTTFSQVYLGVASEHANTTAAVNDTRGIMIYYDGRPIEAVYSSSSGGFTENSENVWMEARPYLRAVAEIYEPNAMVWSRSFTLTQLTGLLASRNINIGSVTSMQLSVSANGRVQEVTFMGVSGSHTVRSEAIRSFFTPSLESRNFTITGGTVTSATVGDSPVMLHIQSAVGVSQANLANMHVMRQPGVALPLQGNIAVRWMGGIGNIHNQPTQSGSIITSTGYQIELSGRGWGHGVGMSQHGAQGMALRGYNFIQILQHYYTGVEIR